MGCNLGKALPNCTGQCRGADSRARRNAADSNGPPLKWQRLPDLSLRGRFAPVAISGRQLRFRRGFPVIHPGTARFPRRFAPRNGNSDSLAPPNHHCNTRNCRRRSLSAATDAIGWYVLIGSLQTASAFPRLPRPLWGLAMTHQGSARCTSPPAMTRQTNRPLKRRPRRCFQRRGTLFHISFSAAWASPGRACPEVPPVRPDRRPPRPHQPQLPQRRPQRLLRQPAWGGRLG